MSHPQRVLNLPQRPSYQAADFFISDTNRLAHRWIESWPQWPNHCLVLHGPKGCGKTHLAQIWREKSGAGWVKYVDLPLNLDDLCQQHKALVVEDVPEGFNETQLFHLYNAVQQAGGHVLLTTETPPSAWQIQLPDLKSRMQAALWAGIEPADDELLRAMLRKVFADEQISVASPVVEYLLNHCERSFDGLLQAVRSINGYALATKRRITLPLVKAALGIE